MSASSDDPRHGAALALNREAGTHPVTTDLEELEVARRASARSWSEFTYYEMRYGERGARFGVSDSAWLIALCDLSNADALKQIEWLGAVLSSRGMPQIMLETHLTILYEELRRALPHRRGRYAILAGAAKLLASARKRQIADHNLKRLISQFNERVGRDLRDRYGRIGELLVSAVADEANGIGNAVISIEPWLTDRKRFHPQWIESVRKTINEARRATRSSAGAPSPPGRKRRDAGRDPSSRSS